MLADVLHSPCFFATRIAILLPTESSSVTITAAVLMVIALSALCIVVVVLLWCRLRSKRNYAGEGDFPASLGQLTRQKTGPSDQDAKDEKSGDIDHYSYAVRSTWPK